MESNPGNTIADLRAELFATLRALNDKANPMDVERAKAVSDVAQVIVNSAKVEVDFVKATGRNGGSGFLELEERNVSGARTVHRLK